MGKFIDMTGWVMSEHGVPDSRLVVRCRTNNYVSSDGRYFEAQWICECTCPLHGEVIARGSTLRNGGIKSCGCLKTEIIIERNKNFHDKNPCGFCEDGNGKWMLFNNSDKKAFYDVDDAEEIEKHIWWVDTKGYARTLIDGSDVMMHQYLGYNRPDHYNRNKLDNRRSNLKTCTKEQNAQNHPLRKDNTYGVIGIQNKNGLWQADITENRTYHYLGLFSSFDDAVKARLCAEKKYFGEFSPQRHLFEQYGIIKDGSEKS